MKLTKLLLGLCLMPFYLQANIWQGKIGKSEVYLYLHCDLNKKINIQSDCGNGSYFYRKSLQDIKFEEALPSTKAYALNLQVKHSMKEGAKAEELFTLNYKDGKLIGFWKQNAKRLKVELKPFSIEGKGHDSEEIFENFREKFLKYKRERVEKFPKQKKELVWIKEEHTGTKMFRMGNGFSSKVRNIVNPILDTAHKEDALFYLTCASRWAYGTGVETLVNKVTYLSQNLISYSRMSSYFCGGAHPDFGTSYELFDVQNGKKYVLEDIIKFQDKVPNNSDSNWEKRSKYETLVAKKLRELAFKAEGMKLEVNEDLEKDAYDPYSLDYWNYMSWSYEKKGIRFFLQFSTPERAFRGDSYLIPFKLLEPYKNKSFPYSFGDEKAYVPKVEA